VFLTNRATRQKLMSFEVFLDYFLQGIFKKKDKIAAT